MIQRVVCSRVALSLLSGSVFLLAGCNSANFGAELADRPQPQPIRNPGEQTIRLPQDQKFSIIFSPSQQAPGLSGSAKAAATATRDGNAGAAAEVIDGGTATAAFQLGHAFVNDTQQQMDLQVSVAAKLAYEVFADPPSIRPDAMIGLRLYVKGPAGHTLRNYELLGHSSEEGGASSEETRDFRFDLTLGPAQTVQLYFAGQSAIDVQDGHRAKCSLRVSDVQMTIQTRAAPPIPPSGAGQN